MAGRIDPVRRKDTGETTIVDLKSSDRAQAEEVTETQLHIYALGYRELTGRDADYVEIYNLDERKGSRAPSMMTLSRTWCPMCGTPRRRSVRMLCPPRHRSAPVSHAITTGCARTAERVAHD